MRRGVQIGITDSKAGVPVVIICIYEELVTQEFAHPQELPISTTRVHVI